VFHLRLTKIHTDKPAIADLGAKDLVEVPRTEEVVATDGTQIRRRLIGMLSEQRPSGDGPHCGTSTACHFARHFFFGAMISSALIVISSTTTDVRDSSLSHTLTKNANCETSDRPTARWSIKRWADSPSGIRNE
jgi:hypothetical protein